MRVVATDASLSARKRRNAAPSEEEEEAFRSSRSSDDAENSGARAKISLARVASASDADVARSKNADAASANAEAATARGSSGGNPALDAPPDASDPGSSRRKAPSFATTVSRPRAW